MTGLCYPLASAQTSFYVYNSYAIPWASVPTKTDPTPAKNLTSNCICNLTPYVCDLNCCCDELCVPAVVSAASAAQRCLPAGPPNETLSWCSSSTSQQQVSLPSSSDFFDITVTTAGNTFLDQLLCIVKSANPDLGNSYPDPPVGNTNNNAAAVGSCPKDMDSQAPASYQFNTPVYVNFRNTREPLTLPYAAISDECNDQFQVGFLSSVPDTSPSAIAACTRTLVNSSGSSILQRMCTSPVASISKFANMGFYASFGATTATAATIVSINVLDPLSGTTTPVSAASTSTTTTSFNATTGICSNFVVGVRMHILYTWADTGVGSINAINVVLLVMDTSTEDTLVQQQIQVLWAQYQQKDQRVLVSFSGNPGYLSGFPVLAGFITSNPDNANQLAISRLVQGMPMPVASLDGECAGVGQQPVTFGFNTTTNCAISLTANTLADLCQNRTKDPTFFLRQLLDGVWTSITNGTLYLGIWGNSNAAITTEWLQVVITGWPNPSDLTYTDRQCANVIVGYDLQILTGLASQANNPQSKILYANLCLRKATWTFPTGQDTNTTYPFMMTSSVSFISKQQSTISQSKPAPPFLRPLPVSIFYPFVTSGARVLPAPALLLVLMLMAVALGAVASAAHQ